jgi:hypothetical protein
MNSFKSTKSKTDALLRKKFTQVLRRTSSYSGVGEIIKFATKDIPLPNFCIVGAGRCGTSTMFDMLQQHPDVCAPTHKEINFFNVDTRYAKGLAFYKSYFAGYAGEAAVGEASPMYLPTGILYRNPDRRTRYWTKEDSAIIRLARSVPETKVIVCLRCPADRYLSGRQKNFYQGKSGNFDDIEKQFKIDKKNEECGMDSGALYGSRYKTHLKHALQLFPYCKIKIIIFEEFIMDPISVMSEVFSFLGVEDTFEPVIPLRTNASHEYNKTSKGAIKKIDRMRHALRKEFDGDIKCVEDILDRKIQSWRF